MNNNNGWIRFVSTTALSAALLMTAIPAAAQDKWYPSRWGPEDEIGNANLLTPERALAASKLVTTGKVYSLGITVGPDTPAYPPRGCSITVVQPGQQAGGVLGHSHTNYNDDILSCWVGIGTQLDGLGHIGIDNVYYNGNHAKDFADISGLKKLSVDKVPPMVTRGVLLDMAAYLNTDVVKEGTAFNRAEIDGAAKKQGVEIREGDVVIFHTGWLSLIDKDPKRFASVEPGLGKEGAQYLASKGVVAIGADNWAVEVLPAEKDVGVFEIHQIALARNGIYLLENVNTAELAKDKAYEFMFVLGHNKYKGAVQSMINPVAIR